MEKNININLNGINFTIVESAYQKLENYLNTVKKYFSGNDDAPEIMKDIESRLSELFTSRLDKMKNVITNEDIDWAIANLGQPEDFKTTEQDTAGTKTSQTPPVNQGPKRMFRDIDNKVLGGVAAGLGAYFGMDPVWIRLLFFFTLFLGGFSALLYCVLWIALPSPKTLADKIQMQGDPVNLSSIENALKKKTNINSNPGEENLLTRILLFPFRVLGYIFDVLIEIFKSLGTILRWIFGLLVMFIIVVLCFVVTVLLAVGTGLISIVGIPILHIASPSVQYLGIFSTYFLIIIPFVFLFLLCFSLIRKKIAITALTGFSLLAIWLIALVLFIISIGSVAPEFSVSSEVQEKKEFISQPYKTVFLKVNNIASGKRFNNVQINIKGYDGDKIEVLKKLESRGSNNSDAKEKARRIKYNILQKDSILFFDNAFSLPEKEPFRVQQVAVTIYAPYNLVIKMEEEFEEILDEYPEIVNYNPDDLYPHDWLITEEGMECLTCTPEDKKLSSSDKRNIKLQINDLKLDIKALKREIKFKIKDELEKENLLEGIDEISVSISDLKNEIGDYSEEEIQNKLDEISFAIDSLNFKNNGVFKLHKNINGIKLRINGKSKRGKKAKGTITIGDSVVIRID